MKFLKVVSVKIAAAVVASACSPLASWAALSDNQLVEEAACEPMSMANQALRKMPRFQTTLDAVVEDETQRVLTHADTIVDHGLQYQRLAPYAALAMSGPAIRLILSASSVPPCFKGRSSIS